MKKYQKFFNESLSQTEKDKLSKELDDLQAKVKKAEFIDPKDMRRIDNIMSLLMSDGKSTEWRLAPGKPHGGSNRVTSFTRDRR